jgi:hypothetical protein
VRLSIAPLSVKNSRTGKLGWRDRFWSRIFPIGNFLFWNASPAPTERKINTRRTAIAVLAVKATRSAGGFAGLDGCARQWLLAYHVFW